nr:DnaJ domain-containing protein [Sphingomonas sp.]
MVDHDYYQLLGVTRAADPETIKRAYRRLAKECHPDRHNGCSQQEAKFKAISEAYDVLRDPQKRAAYDRFGKAAFQNGGGGQDPFGGGGFEGFSDIFSSIFGEFMDQRTGGRANPARGADLRYDLELALEEAFAGKEASLTVEALAGCEQCQGRGCKASADCARTCSTCGGAGKVRAQQGFFVVERGCPSCRGSGATIADPCSGCEGEG